MVQPICHAKSVVGFLLSLNGAPPPMPTSTELINGDEDFARETAAAGTSHSKGTRRLATMPTTKGPGTTKTSLLHVILHERPSSSPGSRSADTCGRLLSAAAPFTQLAPRVTIRPDTGLYPAFYSGLKGKWDWSTDNRRTARVYVCHRHLIPKRAQSALRRSKPVH